MKNCIYFGADVCVDYKDNIYFELDLKVVSILM